MREINSRNKSSDFPSNNHSIFEGKSRANQGKESTNCKNDIACIRDIFLHRAYLLRYIKDKNSIKTEFKEKLNIYPNMVEIRSTNDFQLSKNNPAPAAGKKCIIKEFSRKSRREFIKFLCKITDILKLWLDLTFSDDVMKNKSERTEVSNKVLNRFRRIVIEKYSSIKIVYKREWVPRKSGNLKGEYIPHFHMFISSPDGNEDYEFINLAVELARIWVDCTRTKEIPKALKVAINPDSYRIINDQKHALKYASKYVTKPGENWAEDSIGRSWGKIGKFNIAKPEIREMTPTEMVHIKRSFRKIAPKKHFIQKALKRKETPTFLIIKGNTVNRIIEHTQNHLENECNDFFKAKGDQI